MTAPDLNALVDLYSPLARAVARQWGAAYPWLADDFESDAGLALFRALRSPAAATAANLGGLVRVAVRYALIRRLRIERTRNPVSFARREVRDHVGALVDPLDAVADDTPEVGAALEVAELLALLPADRRADVERHFREGVTYDALGTERGVTGAAVRQAVGAALAQLRAQLTP